MSNSVLKKLPFEPNQKKQLTLTANPEYWSAKDEAAGTDATKRNVNKFLQVVKEDRKKVRSDEANEQ
ncbi:MAG: hypothetical protein JNK82_32265 [Myxococcaceae bacterium]|nr:hypothetical protein [Myxococcaceae bacterium]